MSNAATAIKDPSALLDYQRDWAPFLSVGDTIVASTWTVPAGITKTDEQHTGTSATVWVSGGTVGETYALVNHVTTAGGRQENFTLVISIIAANGFTYSGNPGSRPVDLVRFLLQDTDESKAEFTDSEISWLLTQWGDSAYQAARAGAEALASKYSGQASTMKQVGDLRLQTSYQQRATDYAAMAERIAQQMVRLSAPMPVVNPNAIVPTTSYDSDAGGEPGTDFRIGGTDNRGY